MMHPEPAFVSLVLFQEYNVENSLHHLSLGQFCPRDWMSINLDKEVGLAKVARLWQYGLIR